MKTTKPGLYYKDSIGLFELRSYGEHKLTFTWIVKKNVERSVRIKRAKYSGIIYIGEV